MAQQRSWVETANAVYPGVSRVAEVEDEITALRARVAQLEAALRAAYATLIDMEEGDWSTVGATQIQIDAALAATPADAGRRWEAMRAVVTHAGAVIAALDDRTDDRLLRWGEPIEVELTALRDALARLDAEGKP